jgi:hypothetical protein
MMPITVPSRPTNGDTEPTEASRLMPRLTSADTASAWRASSRRVSSIAPSSPGLAWAAR